MADFLPRLDEFIPGYSDPLPPLPTKPVAPVRKPVSVYDSLTPEQKKQADLLLEPRSALGEVGVGAVRGLTYELPKMIGQALQAPGQPGDVLYDAGTAVKEFTAGNNARFLEDQNPEAHGAVTQAFAQGASMLAPSLAPLLAAPLGPVGVGAAGAALFGGSQFTETYEKAIKAGKSPEEARQLGLQTGAIEAGGEAVGGVVLGSFLKGARGLVRSGKVPVKNAIDALQNPAFLKEFGKLMLQTGAVETATEMGQNYGEAAVEKGAGISTEDPYHAATAAIGPTLAMTALLGPFAGGSLHRQQSQNKLLIDQATVPDPKLGPLQQIQQVRKAAMQVEPVLGGMAGTDEAHTWMLDQLEKTVKSNEEQVQLAQQKEQQNAAEQQQAAEALAQQQQQAAAKVAVDQTQVPGLANVPGVRPRVLPDTLTPTQYEDMWGQLLQQRDVAGFDQQTQADLPAAMGQVRAPGDAAAAQAGVAAQRSEADRQAAVAQAIVNSPEGALSFSQFTTEVRKTRRAKDGELPLKGGKLSESSLRDAYVGYMNTFLQQQEQQAAEAVKARSPSIQSGVPEGQGSLPLEIAQEVDSSYQLPATGVRTAMTEALVKAQREKAQTDATAQVEAQKQAELDKLQNIGRGTRQAELAEAGKITGNTPIDLSGLQNGWKETAVANGMKPEAVRGEAKAIIEQAFTKAAGQNLFVNQLNTLRKARDRLAVNSEARDSLDAFITRLGGNKNVQAQSTPQVGQGTEPQRAEVQVPIVSEQGTQGNATTDTQGQGKNADGQGQDAKLLKPAFQPFVSPKEQRKIKGNEFENRYFFEVENYNFDIGVDRGTNGQWIEDYNEARNAAAGLSKDGKPKRKSEKESKAQQNAKAALDWLVQYEGRTIEEIAPELLARRERVLEVNTRMRESAKAAEKAGENQELYAYTQRVTKLGEKARKVAQDALMQLSNKMKKEFAERLGKNIDDLTPKELAQLQQDYDEIVEESDAYRNSVNKTGIDELRYDAGVEVAVRYGTVADVIKAIEASPYSTAVQPLMDRLKGLNLTTKFQIGYSADELAGLRKRMPVPGMAEETQGTYYHNQNKIVLNPKGGISVGVVAHELVHAVTFGRLYAAEHLLNTTSSRNRTVEQQKLVSDLQELKILFNAAKTQAKNPNAYGWTNYEEFLAEANSSEAFQAELKSMEYQGSSFWKKFLDWITEMLGAPSPLVSNALEHAMDLSMRFESDSRFQSETGPGAAMKMTDNLMQIASSEWEKALQKSSMLGNAKMTMTRALLQGLTTHHIQLWIDKSPSLKAIAAGIHKYFTADAVKTKLIQDKSAEFYLPTKMLQQILRGMPSEQRPAMEREISTLAMEMSGLNIDLNKDYAGNLALNKTLEQSTQMKAYINDLHARYMKLPLAVRQPLEQTFAVNRKNFIQQTTTSLRNYLSTFSDARTGRWLSRLDIRDPSLDQGAPLPVTPGKLPYYLDRYTANLDKRLQEIFKEIADAKLGKEFNEIQTFYSSAVGNPYQHLGRMGTNFVEFTLLPTPEALARVQQALAPFNVVIGQPNKTNQHVFMKFENSAVREQAFAVMKALEGIATEPNTVRGGSMENREDMDRARGVPQFARTIINRLDESFGAAVAGRTPQERTLVEEMHQSIKRWALDATPDTSARKALAQRNTGGRTLGYEADFVRSFTLRANGMISTLSNAYSLPLFSEAFADMKKQIEPLAAQDSRLHAQAQMLYDEIAQRFSNSMNPVESPVIDGIKAFGYNFYLAMSPAFWLVNLAQPYHLTLPYLGGRYGFIQSAKAMGNATNKALSIVKATLATGISEGKALGGVSGAILGVIDARLVTGASALSAGEQAFIKALAAAGQLDATQSHELGRISEGADPRAVAISKFASAGSHYTEVVNRLTAGLAAYNLEASKGQNNHEAAVTRGLLAVKDTQFEYSDRNIARALGRHGVVGKVTPLLASFQQYSFQTTELLVRMIRDARFPIPANATPQQRAEILADRKAAQLGLAGILGTTTVLAGTLGLPFANVVARLMDAMGDDDDPSDVKSAYRAWLADWAGKDIAEALARGVPRALLGFDMSTRAGLQDILPGSRFFTDRRSLQDKIKSGALDMMGPAVSGGVDITNGLSHMLDGRVLDGLTEMLPLSLRGAAKAVKLSQVGFTNATGNQLPIPVDGWDMFVQSLGFTPSRKAEQSEANFAFKTRDSILKQEKAKLSNRMYLAIEREGTLDSELLQALSAWNTKNPQHKIDLKAGLTARAKARGVAEVSGTDIAELPRYLPVLERYNYAVTR